jgi:membrane protein YqaA with SNARE-associated domain
LILLFFISLGAATLLPGGSELYFLYELNKSPDLKYLILFIATLGNTLGSVVNFFLGKYASSWAVKKNYIKSLHVEKAKRYFDKFGSIALLLSWTPIIGDPITFVAGTLRYNFWKFLLLVTISKLLRYSFLLYLFNS